MRIIATILFICLSTWSQENLQSTIDDVQNGTPEERISAYTELIYEFRNDDPIRSLDYFDEAERLIPDAKDPDILSHLYRTTALTLIGLGDFEKAEEFLLKSLNYLPHVDPKFKANQLSLIGYTFYIRKMYRQSLTYQMNAFKINLQNDTPLGIGFNANNIGDIYFHLALYDSALYYHREAQNYFLLANHKLRYAIAQQYTAKTFNAMGRYSEAYTLSRKCYNTFINETGNDTINISHELARTKIIMGSALGGLGKTEEADSIINVALNDLHKIHMENEISNALFAKSFIYEKANRIVLANKYYKEATDSSIASTLRSKNRILELSRKRFEKEKLNTRIQAIEIEQERNRGTLFLIILIFVLVISTIAFYGFNQKRKLSKKLAQQNIELDFINKQFSGFLENADEAFRLIDSEGKIVLWNKANYKLTGISREQAINQYVWDIVDKITPQDNKTDKYTQKLKAKRLQLINTDDKQLLVFESKIVSKNNEVKFVLTTSFPIQVGEKHFLGEITRDMTDRKNYETQLIKARDLAEASDKMKSEFLAQMSHEIRTPLNTVLSFTSLLKAEAEGKFDDQMMEIFSSIDRAGSRIIRTIDMLLNMSEIQTGLYDYHPKSIDLIDDVLNNCINDFKRKALDKGLGINLKVFCRNTQMKLDEYSTVQIFQNLIENAIKYTERGDINIVVGKNNDNFLTVDISDTGIGISEEYIDKLFEPFSQEEQGYTRKFEGNGLGLALVEKYCGMNNLSVEVKSKKGEGTTFTIVFNNYRCVEKENPVNSFNKISS